MRKFINRYDFSGLGFVLWFALILVIYIATAIHWLHHPFNRSNYDTIFSIYIIGSMLFACVVCMYSRDRSYIVPVGLFLLFIILFFVIAILSKAFLSLLTFCWILILGVVLGEKIISLILMDPILSWLEKKLLSTAIGFGVFSLFILTLALTGFLYLVVVLATLLLLTLIFAKDIASLFATFSKEVQKIPERIKSLPNFVLVSSLLSIVLIMAFVNFIGAIAPEIQCDSLNYHLNVPKIYIAYHHIVNLPEIMQSYFAKSIEMLYALGLILSDQIAAKLISFGFSVLATLTLFCIGKRLFSTAVAVLAMTLFYLTPLTSWLSTTTYTELAVCFYIMSVFLVLALWQQNHKNSFLLLCGILAGFAFSAKLAAGLFIFPIGIIILILSYLHCRKVSMVLIDATIFSLPILLLSAPWYLITYLQTGNPIFPFFNAVFKSPLVSVSNQFMNLKTFGMGYGWRDFIFLPWHLTYSSDVFMEAVPGGVIGLVFLLALPAIFFIRKNIKIALLFFIVLFSLVVWFFIGQYLRYLIPVIAILSLLAAYISEYFVNNGTSRYTTVSVLFVIVSLFATVPVYLVSFWSIHTRVPYEVAFGLKSREAYLTDAIRTYQPSLFLNEHYDYSKIKVVLIGSAANYYINAYSVPILGLFDFPEDRTLPSYLHKKKFTHILIDTFAAQKFLLRLIEKEIIDKGYAKLVFESKCTKVYQLIE